MHQPTEQQTNPPPTPRERDALAAIVEHIREWGCPPAQRELADALGVSFRRARVLLEGLQEKGFVVIEPGQSRGLVLTVAGWRELGREPPDILPTVGG